jgi:hypothetical protein
LAQKETLKFLFINFLKNSLTITFKVPFLRSLSCFRFYLTKIKIKKENKNIESFFNSFTFPLFATTISNEENKKSSSM